MAMRPDMDLVPLDERRGRRLELNLFPLDSLRGQVAADPEEAARGLHPNLLRFDRWNLGRAAEIDLNFLRRQPAIDANGSARSEFLDLDPALDRQGSARGNLLRLDGAVDLKRAARLRLLRLRVVAGLDLQVRLLGDLAAREPFLELAEDVFPLHWLHRKVEARAKYVSFRARASSVVFAIQFSVFRRVRVDFAASSRARERGSVSFSPALLCPIIPG